MRDIVVTLIVFGGVPLILFRPWLGILMWCWISYMNPHRLAWGFAVNMPFAMVTAIATLMGLVLTTEPKRVPWTRETILLLCLTGWEVFTTFFALNPPGAWFELQTVAKIQLMTFITMVLITNEKRLNAMIWVIAMSIGFFGIKGGFFTIATGGVHRVWGPMGSWIAGNNEIALALTMVIPLVYYLASQTPSVWLRWALRGSMILMAIAAIGSQSRGGMLATVGMGFFFWLKSRNKFVGAVLVVVAAVTVLAIMPPEYFDRMHTIENYEQDRSALGRINAWYTAWNIAVDRPFVGGGFETFTGDTFGRYAPDPDDYHDVHSIYFEVLGEHGFVGLGLFALLWASTWFTASGIARRAKRDPQLKRFAELTLMVQTSLIGYLVGGAFLGLAYFDLPYHLMTIVVITKLLMNERATANQGHEATARRGPNVLTPQAQAPR